MALTGLHVLADYQTELHTFLVKVEKLESLPYFDSASPPLATIGIGFNIDTVSKNLGYVLEELWINGQLSEKDPTKTANQVFKAVIDSVPDGGAYNSALQAALNNALREHFPSLYGPAGIIEPNGIFNLTEAQSYTVLDKIVEDKRTDPDPNIGLDAKLAAYGIDATAMYGTREYLALTSLNYNTKSGPTDLIGKGLRNAIANNDRAEAWYEIRYNSNAGSSRSPGIAKRRYYEAEVFGLYGQNTPAAELDNENKGVYRMLTRHRQEIDNYEGQFGVRLDGTWGQRNMIAEANDADQGYGLVGTDYEIDSILGSLQDARTYLVQKYLYDKGIFNIGIDLDHILVGESDGTDGTIDTRYYRGTDTDVLTGTDNSDLIFGESGNDILEGGLSNDVLYGGSGLDIYRYRPGDGVDVIIDSSTATEDSGGDGKGAILYDPDGTPQILAVGTRDAQTDGSYSGPWQSLDKTITYTLNGNDLTIATPGGTITVKDFNRANNDLNIRLLDLPLEPPTDLAAPDPAYDPTANVLRDGTPSADSAATPRDLDGDGDIESTAIHGTAGAETIHGLAGDDDIYGNGGGDRLYGDAWEGDIYHRARWTLKQAA